MNLYLETDNLVWAVSVAGIVKDAIEKHGKAIKFKLKSNDPVIQHIGQNFIGDGSVDTYTKVSLPETEEEFSALEKFSSDLLHKEIMEFHGIKQDLGVPRLGAAQLAEAALFKDHGLKGKAKPFYPRWKVKDSSYNIVIDDESLRVQAENWARGYGIEPKIRVIGKDVEGAQALFNEGLKVAILHYNNPYLFLMQSQYKGFDNLGKVPKTISVFPAETEASRFTCPIWAGCTPVGLYDDLNLENDGKLLRLMEEVNFDHHEYARRSARKSNG